MAEEKGTLSTFYDSWKLYQDHLAEALAPLTPEQLAQRPAPGMRSIGETTAHIIATRVGWFVHFLGEEPGEAAAFDRFDAPGAPARSSTELVNGLEASWKLMRDALARWDAGEMAKRISREREGRTYEFSRSWVIYHLLEHDLH
ncbi:MAG TPA: DinB family protein, partial [Ktedonobacterales bacterium]